MVQKQVFVLGSGVIGLSVALELQARGYQVTILARDLPPGAISTTSSTGTSIESASLKSQDWASPWAGFNWCSFAPLEDKETQKRDEATFLRWKEMVERREVPRETMELVPFTSTTPSKTEHWFKDLVPDYKEHSSIPSDPEATTVTYKSFVASAPAYLSYLVSQLLHHRKDSALPTASFHETVTFASLADVFSHPLLSSQKEDDVLLVNATGMGSLYLSDVADTSVYPIRGQTVLVSSPSFKESPVCVMSLQQDEPTYVIPRGASGLVILGGTFEHGDWHRDEREDATERILRNCLAVCPQLLAHLPEYEKLIEDEADSAWKHLDVVSVNVGIRPARKGETRVELDAVKDKRGNYRPVLHAYGAGKAGYQSSVGIAQEAADWADKHFGR